MSYITDFANDEEAFESDNPWTAMEMAKFVKEIGMHPNVLLLIVYYWLYMWPWHLQK